MNAGTVPISRIGTLGPYQASETQAGIVRSDQIRLVPFDRLTPGLLKRWDDLRFGRERVWNSTRNTDPGWPQPFFSPRFAGAVQQARGDVSVAFATRSIIEPMDVLPEPDQVIAFLPLHQIGRIGLPVGRFLNDAQNIVGLAPTQIDWTEWLRGCGLVALDWHAIMAPADQWVDDYRLGRVKSFRADFGGDSQRYLKQIEREHRTIGKQAQKTRKLAREVGDVRVQVDCRCPEILRQVIAWKRQQYQRTHILDLFLPDWTRKLVEILHHQMDGDREASSFELENDFHDQPLRGILSVLWAGDRPVAAHFGMIERGQLHYWFPTYDPAFAKYSPGTALFTEIVRRSSEHGIDCIDMGYGEQPYKQKQAATTSELAFGTITDSKWHYLTHSVEHGLVNALKRMPMKDAVKRQWRTLRPAAGIKKLG